MKVAHIILRQLGGSQFLTMTGARPITDGNTLRLHLMKNMSKANRLYITLEADDTYTMRFFHYTAGRLDKKTFEWKEDKVKEIKTVEGVYCDMLKQIFEEVTGMYTHL